MLLSSCLEDHKITVSAFKRRIQAEYPPDVVQSFEDSLRNDDKVNWQFAFGVYGIYYLQAQFIVQFLMDFPYQGIVSTPLIQKLFPFLEPDEELLEEIPDLDQPPVTVVTPRVDQVCGRLFKYYQNFRVERSLLVREGPSMQKEAVEIHGASPEISWVSDEVAPGYHQSVRVDNTLFQVGALFKNFYIFSHGYRSRILYLLSLMQITSELGTSLQARV